MIIVNLSHLNASNGMFWYAIDKIRSLGDAPVTVLVGTHLSQLVRQELANATIRVMTKRDAAVWIVRRKLWRRTKDRIVTFTSHPLPFVPDQTIAFYDDYPFVGHKGRLKRALFLLAARTSGCRIGIINRSLAIPFLMACGIAQDRIFFDSAFPAVDLHDATVRSPTPGTPLKIGLVGTDSRKKNYAAIFSETIAQGREKDISFLLYGLENEYVLELRDEFKTIDLSVISSDKVQPIAFFDRIDYLISAATSEGYGRPMGLAAALGVPLFLLRSPVFLEFFGAHAHFFDDVGEMMRYVTDTRPPAVAAVRSIPVTASDRSPFFA